MKKFWKYFLILITMNVSAQNLVPNPSFEDTIQCPTDLNQVDRSLGWFAADGTPDYYNSCFTIPIGLWNVDVPSNSFGYQYAYAGDAYCGLATFYTAGGATIREAIGAQLIQPLLSGQKYFLTFRVSLHNSLQNSCAANKIGFFFSTNRYEWSQMTPVPRQNQSQFFSDSIVTDTSNWVTIRGSFIADSNFTYCYIGNFFSDSLTNYILFQGASGFSYYYIDGICVSIDSLFCESLYNGSEESYLTKFNAFPNPFEDYFSIELLDLNDQEIILYDLFGRRINSIQKFNGNFYTIYPQIDKGIILLVIKSKTKIYHRIIYKFNK